jgi:hypothetical protein
VFPEARFVVTDRDPYRCIVSLTVLGHTIAGWFCDPNPLTDDGSRSRTTSRYVRSKLASIAAFTDEAPSRVMHVPYPALVRSPVDIVHRVLEPNTADEALPAEVLAFLERQQAGGRAAPPANLDSMGYDDRSDVWSDEVVRSYCERFGIEPERTRTVGAT